MLCAVARRPAIPTVLTALALTPSLACSPSAADKGHPTSYPTLATEPAPTTTTNPYAVPTVIDAAYVNRVLAGLDAQMGGVTRMIVQTKTIPPGAYDRLRTVYGTDQRLHFATNNFQADMRRGFVDYRQPPGNKSSDVTALITARTSCIFAMVVRDYTKVGVDSRSADTQWVALKPLDSARD